MKLKGYDIVNEAINPKLVKAGLYTLAAGGAAVLGHKIYKDVSKIHNQNKERKLHIENINSKWKNLPLSEKIKWWNIAKVYHLRHKNYIEQNKQFKNTDTNLSDSESKEWANLHNGNVRHSEEMIEKLKRGEDVKPSPFYKG